MTCEELMKNPEIEAILIGLEVFKKVDKFLLEQISELNERIEKLEHLSSINDREDG